jgi:hypothetical protein
MSASIKTTDFNRTIPRTQLRALTFPIASNPGERDHTLGNPGLAHPDPISAIVLRPDP